VAITPGGQSWRDDPDSIGAHVKIEGVGEHAEYLATATHAALDAIHAVHGDGGMPDVTARVNPRLKRAKGKYHGIRGRSDHIIIEIKPDLMHAGFTMAHELGHYLDQWGLDTDGYDFASDDGGSPLAKPIMIALFSTKEVKEVVSFAKKAKGPFQTDFVELALPEEILARAYAQYLAIRSRHPALLEGLENSRRGTSNGPPKHWSDSSFIPVGEAFDSFFECKGWRR
jgi:hypothetical protein